MFLNTTVIPTLLCFLVSLALPPSAVLVLSRAVSFFYDVNIPVWVLTIVAFLSIPLTVAGWILFESLHDRHAIAAIEAIPAPVIQGKWPGNVDLLFKLLEQFNNDYPVEFYSNFSKKLGNTFNTRLLWENMIFTSEPENIKAILASDFPNFEKGPHFRGLMHSVFGVGVFNSDGDMWKFHRAMTRPFFSRERISHFDIFDRHAEKAIALVTLRLSEGNSSVDFQDLVSRFTLDSATEFLFGHCVHSLSAGLPYPHNAVTQSKDLPSSLAGHFTSALAEAQVVVANRQTTGWAWPLFEIFADKSEKSMNHVNAYLGPILENALRRVKDAPPTQKEKIEIDDNETLLDHLVKSTSDPAVLRDEILNMLIAGRDTTAATLTFVVYCLSMYPRVLTRLRAEILEQVGPTNRPTYDDIRSMKYLRAVLNETLRLYSAVPYNTRKSIKATTWPSPNPGGKPMYIPAGTTCAYSVMLMHRRKDLWGPDAEEFDPDRFIDERLKKYLTPKPFIFLPFNAGPRICLGQQFAYNQMSFFLIRLLQNIDAVTLDLDAQPPYSRVPEEWKDRTGRKSIEKIRPKTHLLLHSYGGLWVKMKEAAKTPV